MLYAFPFDSDEYAMTMDARAGVASVIEIEPERYAAQTALKGSILDSDPAYYFQCPPETTPLAWDALEWLLPHMARALPQHFALEQNGRDWAWTNLLLGTRTAFHLGEGASLPRHPLDWLGRQIQEDLILMAPRDDGQTVCAAGHLCFASGWSLGDKMGRTFAETHQEVPGFGELLGRPADLLMARLKPGRPVERLNWTVHATDQLNLAPRLAHDWQRSRREITPENAGRRCFLRLERQTLSRLPHTGGILFTIHTRVHPMEEVSADPERARRLASVLRSMPPATKMYKGLAEYLDALLTYLDGRGLECSP